MKSSNAVLLVFGGAVLLGACSSSDNNPPNNAIDDSATLSWQSCDAGSPLQCASLDVLVDPDDTESGTVSLALNRLPSTSNEPEGIVLMNPGGPGASGIDLLEEITAADALPVALREKYDFIGFDPRGVGGSGAIDCSEFGSTEVNTYLADELAIEEFVTNQVAVANLCEQKYGAYLQHLGSINVVHDMDAIRKAAGEEKIHYLGFSYGTRLGALYLQTYPEYSGHFVLDGSLKPESGVESLIVGAIDAMQESLGALFETCSEIDPDCTGTQLLTALADRFSTLATAGQEEELLILGVITYVAAENPEAGPFLLRPLYDHLQTGDFTVLRDIVESELVDLLDDNDDTTERAVMCADDAVRPTANDMVERLASFNQRSDIFAEIHLSQSGMCSGWPASVNALAPISSNQAPPALVIGGTTDTLTLARWAEEMAQSIGGYYLESDHPGHTVVFNGRSTCVDSLAEEFLLNGLQPTASRCELE